MEILWLLHKYDFNWYLIIAIRYIFANIWQVAAYYYEINSRHNLPHNFTLLPTEVTLHHALIFQLVHKVHYYVQFIVAIFYCAGLRLFRK